MRATAIGPQSTPYVTLFKEHAHGWRNPLQRSLSFLRFFAQNSHICAVASITITSLNPKMLKRQRASSPLPVAHATIPESLPISSDPSSNHGVKRRRIFAPSLDGSSRGWGGCSVVSGDEEDEDDIIMDGRSPTPNPTYSSRVWKALAHINWPILYYTTSTQNNNTDA